MKKINDIQTEEILTVQNLKAIYGGVQTTENTKTDENSDRDGNGTADDCNYEPANQEHPTANMTQVVDLNPSTALPLSIFGDGAGNYYAESAGLTLIGTTNGSGVVEIFT